VDSANSIGQRLIALRKPRRMSQADLAASADVSVDTIRKLEQGQRQSARLDTLVRIAHALDVPVAEVMGKPRGLAVGGQESEILELRRLVVAGPVAETDPPSIDVLRGRIAELWRRYWTGRYAELARDLPGILRASAGATRGADTDDRRAGWGVIAELHQITASLLAHLAYEDLAHVALMRAVTAAEAAEDPLLRAAQHATKTWILTRQGLWSEAETVAVDTAAEIEPVMSKATAEQPAVWGELLRYADTGLARAGRKAEAEDMLRLVQAAASAIGDRRPSMTSVVSFGPTIAGMAAVGIAVATDEPRRALALADQVPSITDAPKAVQSRYLLNVAYAQAMDWQSQAAVDTIRRAEAVAPEAVAQQTIARAIVAELWPRRRKQRLVGIVGLAERMGVNFG
jgi:transcriptional regulator with XRE-family HTH domain